MIKDISILQIHDSRGEKTIKISLKTEKGTFYGCAPSGKSRGKYETKTKKVDSILKSFPRTKKHFINQEEKNIDYVLEKLGVNKIGANLSIAISIAGYRAMSNNRVYEFLNPKAISFPFPIGNVIGGGVHGGYTSIQEFLVIPLNAKTIQEAIETNLKIWKEVGNELKRKNAYKGKNDENAWTSTLDDLDTLDLLFETAKKYKAKLGIDFAANQFYKKKKYVYPELNKKFSGEEQLDFIKNLIKTYDMIYVEDPFHENDFENFRELRRTGCLVIGDDLYATQSKRLKIGIKKKAGNGILIKPDQAGTVSRALDAVRIAKNNFVIIISHRSGETQDSFISDLAVGTKSPFIKCGIAGGERIAKTNRLIKIWSEIKNPKMFKI